MGPLFKAQAKGSLSTQLRSFKTLNFIPTPSNILIFVFYNLNLPPEFYNFSLGRWSNFRLVIATVHNCSGFSVTVTLQNCSRTWLGFLGFNLVKYCIHCTVFVLSWSLTTQANWNTLDWVIKKMEESLVQIGGRMLLWLILKWRSLYRKLIYFDTGNRFIQRSISFMGCIEVSTVLNGISVRQNPVRPCVARRASRYISSVRCRSLSSLLLFIGLLIVMVLLSMIIHLFPSLFSYRT